MLVELRTILRKASYPVYYFDWLFDSFVRNFMVFASIEKDFDLTPFDTRRKDSITALQKHQAYSRPRACTSPLNDFCFDQSHPYYGYKPRKKCS